MNSIKHIVRILHGGSLIYTFICLKQIQLLWFNLFALGWRKTSLALRELSIIFHFKKNNSGIGPELVFVNYLALLCLPLFNLLGH